MRINKNLKSEQFKRNNKIYNIIYIYSQQFPLRFKNKKNTLLY